MQIKKLVRFGTAWLLLSSHFLIKSVECRKEGSKEAYGRGWVVVWVMVHVRGHHIACIPMSDGPSVEAAPSRRRLSALVHHWSTHDTALSGNQDHRYRKEYQRYYHYQLSVIPRYSLHNTTLFILYIHNACTLHWTVQILLLMCKCARYRCRSLWNS